MEELEALLETGGVAAVELAASAVAERGGQTPPCPSCNTPMIGPYCAVCGQPRNTHRRTLKGLVHEFVKDVVSFDSRILRTGRALLLRPGELPNAFRDGRTQPYVPAVRLYLFVSLLFFLFLSVSGLALLQFGMRVETVIYTHDAQGHVLKSVNGKKEIVGGLKSDAAGNLSLADPRVDVEIPDMKADGHTINHTLSSRLLFFQPISHYGNSVPPLVAKALSEMSKDAAKKNASDSWILRRISASLTRLQTDPAALNEPIVTWIPRILFVLLPLFAALLALFYIRQRKEYLFVDHLVFSLTMHTFAFVVLIGAALLAQVLAGEWVAVIAWLALSLYFFLSLKFFYRQRWPITTLKFAGISLVYFFFFLCPALGVAIVASVVGV